MSASDRRAGAGAGDRAELLRRLALVDTPPEPALDRLARVASRSLRAPVALFSVVDERRQFFKALVGLGEPWASRRETPLTHSFCRYLVATGRPLFVADAREHPELRHNLAIPDLGVVAYAGHPVTLRDGTVLGALCVIDSVPRTWTAEDAGTLADLAAALEDELELRATVTERNELLALTRVRAEEIEALLQEARAHERRRDEFLAMLAHELRNPLAPIINAVELVGVTPGAAPAACAIIARQAWHLSRLVDGLLDVSRLTRGAIPLRREEVSLGAVIERAVESVRSEVETRRHVVTVALPPEPIDLQADPVRLEQAVANLVENAAKYTAPGGRIEIAASSEGGRAVVRVRDNGVGLAREDLRRVFDLFVQVDRSLDRSQGGLGIGLTLVRSIVELHGGSVTAESRGPGHGCEFVVTLPVDRTAPASLGRLPAYAVAASSSVVAGAALSRPRGPGSSDRPAAPEVASGRRDDGGGEPRAGESELTATSPIEPEEPGRRAVLSLVPATEGFTGTGGAAASLTLVGRTAVRSSLREPSTVSLGASPLAVASGAPLSTTPTARTRRVLIVDDNEDAADTLAEVLALWGHEVHVARSGPQALLLAGEVRPDTMLLDIGLPGMDGFELARTLRADPRLGVGLMVAITGYGQPEMRRRSEASGFDHHLVKPVDLGVLRALLLRP